MVKKIIFFILTAAILFSAIVFAEGEQEAQVSGETVQSETPRRAPRGERPYGRQEGEASLQERPQGGMLQERQRGDANAQDKQLGEQAESGGEFGGQRMQGGFHGGTSFGGEEAEINLSKDNRKTGFLGFVKEYFTPIISLVLLAAAYVFVIFYKRKMY